MMKCNKTILRVIMLVNITLTQKSIAVKTFVLHFTSAYDRCLGICTFNALYFCLIRFPYFLQYLKCTLNFHAALDRVSGVLPAK